MGILDVPGEPAGLSTATRTSITANFVAQDADPTSAFRVQQDARLASTIATATASASGPAFISALGDSITAGGQTDPVEGTVVSYAGLLRDALGVVVYNPSVPGERIGDTATRFGAPITFTVPGAVIPADTNPFAVTLVSPNVSNFIGAASPAPQSFFVGTFLSVPVSVRYTGSVWTMNRTTATTASKPVPTAGGIFRTTDANQQRGSILISNSGRNGGTIDSQTRAMISRLTSPKRAILISPLFRAAIAATDSTLANLAAELGVTYFDMRAYLAANGMNDEGLTPTSQDSTDITNGIVPASLFIDGIHPTAAGHRAIARRLGELLVSLGYSTTESTYFPPRAIPLPVTPSYVDAERGLDLRTAGALASKAPTAAIQSSQTLDIRMAFTDLVNIASGPTQNFIRRQNADATVRDWSWLMFPTGKMRFTWSPTGVTSAAIVSDSADWTIPAGALRLRLTFNAANRVTAYYYGQDSNTDGTWTQIGTSSASGAATSLVNSTSPLTIAGLSGRVRSVSILNSAATVIMAQDFTVPAALTAGWNLSGGAVIRTS